MKCFIETCTLLLAYLATLAQPSGVLSIEECYKLAREHYPLVRQTEVLLKASEYSIDNISKSWYPQVNFNGQVSYQSDVTEIPIKLPNVYIESPSRDQYKAFAEITQSLYDAGISKQQKKIVENTEMVEQQKIEVELYKLKDRINQLFFGVLLIDEQLKQVQMLKKDIQSGINKVEGALSNGAALKSGVDVLKAELLKNQQHETELTSARKSYLTMLGLFINKKTDENTSLQKPRDLALVSVVNRPEIGLFELQKKNIALQNTLIGARNFPRIGLFVQAGYGKPALNFLKNQFKPYYVGGLKISWSLAGFYTEKKDRLQLDLNSQSLDIQKETFLFNTNVSLSQQKEDIQKIEALIKTDGEIIILRTSIKNAVNGQLTYGTITSSDYLREVNAEDQARQNLLIHNIQLLMTQYTYNAMAGN
jgi:outer membrane protein TolC